jgi:small subunit ribosomal protein S20
LPHSVSATKRLRQSIKRQIRNKAVKTHLKTRLKKFRAAVAAGSVDDARKQGLLLQKSFDKAVTQGVIHKNRAGRVKSSASLRLNELLRSQAGE